MTMKKIMRGVALTGLFSMLAACGGPELDTSSKTAMVRSVGEIVKGMDADERVAFQRDLQTVSASYIKFDGSFSIEKAQEAEARLAADLHGKTAKDIGKMADKIRSDKG